MKTHMTPEEHARLHRRRGRQALGLVVAVLVLVGVLTVLHAGVNAMAKLFDDTLQRQEYEDELEGLVPSIPRALRRHREMHRRPDPPRSGGHKGCVYSIPGDAGQFRHQTRPRHRAALLPSVDMDALQHQAEWPQFQR